MTVTTELNGFNATLDELREITEMLKDAENSAQAIIMLGINEVSDLTGWSRQTVCHMFNRRDFPSQHFGKEKKVAVSALREFFKTRHERS